MYDLIVIGGGPAGLRAAHRARERGARTAIVGHGPWGGTAVNDGVAPARTMGKAARLLRDVRESCPQFGIQVGPVTLDFPALMGAVRETVAGIHRAHRFQEGLREAGVDVLRSRTGAHFLSPHKLRVDDQEVEAQSFVICTGGHARSLSFPGSEATLGLKELWSLEKLPATVAVVGGSATGCQVASILASLGSRVTLLEVAPRLLGPEDTQVSETVEARFRARGLEIVTGVLGVDSLVDGQLTYSAADGPVTLAAEAVFVAVGWVGNTERLGLEAAGVETERSFVKVNEYLQSSAGHIYAAGDVTGRMMLTQSAKVQADLATDNLLGGERRVYHPLRVAHGGYTDPEYGGVGLTERDAPECLVEVVHYWELARPVIDRRADGFFKLLVDPSSHQVLGAHAVGDHATDIIQIVAGTLLGECTVDDLGQLELAYPTYGAIVRLAASRVAARLGLRPADPERVFSLQNEGRSSTPVPAS